MTHSEGSLRTSDSVRRLLAVEDEASDVLFETLPGDDSPLWPRVRMFFASALATDELGATGVAASSSRWRTYRRMARSLLPSADDAASLRGRTDVVFISSGVTTSVTDGVERNWLVGDHAEALGEAGALLQWTPRRQGTRWDFPRTRSLDPVNARVDVHAYRHGLSAERAAAVDDLVTRYAALFDGTISHEQATTIASSVRYQERRAPLLRAEVLRILRRLEPHTVVLEDASYGHRGDLIRAMKTEGIHVAEPQHGWIGPSHAAYNVGAALRDPRMLAQLPDELLTFGDFWARAIRHPARATSLGKPHLDRSAAAAPPISARPQIALVASSITNPEATMRLVLDLRDRLPEWRIRFRPHPSERATLAARYPALTDADRVDIDPHDDLYVSLRDCRAVIGVASTVLFEAASFDCDVLVRRSPFTDYYVGELFGPAYDDADDIDALASRLRDGSAAAPVEEFWAPHAAARVAEWAAAQHR